VNRSTGATSDDGLGTGSGRSLGAPDPLLPGGVP
jgi:hypothetical protein